MESNFLKFIALVSLPRDKFFHTGPTVLVLIQWHPQVGKNGETVKYCPLLGSKKTVKKYQATSAI